MNCAARSPASYPGSAVTNDLREKPRFMRSTLCCSLRWRFIRHPPDEENLLCVDLVRSQPRHRGHWSAVLRHCSKPGANATPDGRSRIDYVKSVSVEVTCV